MSKKNIIISSIAGTLAITTALSFIGFNKIKLRSNSHTGHIISTDFDDYTEDDLYDILSETETTIVTGIKNPQQNDNSNLAIEKETSKQDYNSFLAQINAVIEAKGFDEEAKKIIIESYNILYENYNSVYEAYKMSGIPTREEYLQKQFIDAIKNNVEKIKIYNESDVVDSNIFDNAGAYYNPTDKSMEILSKRNFYELCVMFMHELTHAYQNEFINSDVAAKIREENKALWYILTEGEADLSDTASTSNIQKKGNCIVEDDQTECYYTIYGKTADKKYNILYKVYSMWSHLSGYESMQNLKKTGDINSIISIINDKYNVDSTKFIESCQKLSIDMYEGNYQNLSNIIEYIDNFYLDCLSIEIDRINSKESAINMFTYYRYYKLQEQTKYAKSTEDGKKDITEEKYDFSKIEEKLFNKCMEYDVFDIFKENEESCKQSFDAVLRIDSTNSLTTLEPITLSGKNYLLLEEEGKIVLFYDENAVYYDLDGDDKESELLESVEEIGTNQFIAPETPKSK